MSQDFSLLVEAHSKIDSVIEDLEDLTINKNCKVNIHDVLAEIKESREIISKAIDKEIKLKKKKHEQGV
jgi:hypothetical protein